MDETQLNEILVSYRDAINALIERIDSQDAMLQAAIEKVDGLEKLVFDDVINPAKKALEDSIYDAGLSDFSDRYGEKLGGYNDSLKAIEGEDFDIMKQAYDGFNARENKDITEEEWVNELITQVDVQLNSIREALGAPADAKVEIVDDGEGEPEVKVDGEVVTEPETEPVTEVTETETPVEETTEEVADVEEETNPEDLRKLEEELLGYAK